MTERLVEGRLENGACVLDLGCGCGRTIGHLKRTRRFHLVGVDNDADMLLRAGSNGVNVPLIQARAQALPFRGACLDAVICECVLSLLPGLNEVVAEIARVLRPGGFLLCSDLYARAPGRIRAVPDFPKEGTGCCLDGALPSQQWLEILSTQGFNVLAWEDHSRALAKLSAELVFAHGSMERFWRELLGGQAEDRLCRVLNRANNIKPGYFISVGIKR